MQDEATKSHELQQLIEVKDKEIEDLKARLNESACGVNDVRVALEPSESQQLPPLIPASAPSLSEPLLETTSKQSFSTEQIRKFHEENREKSPEISDPMLVTDDSDSDESDIQFTPNQHKESSKEKLKQKSRAKARANTKTLMKIALAQMEPWKCHICLSFFKTNEALRLHITANHPTRKMCKRCPKTSFKRHSSDITKHEQIHIRFDLKKGEPNVYECKLCHVWFGTRRLATHMYKFHMPREEK